jgi:hypothetical protein
MVDKYASLVAPQCKLDDHVAGTIKEYISKGNYIKTACIAAGIDQHTFINWAKRADTGEEPFLSFFRELDIAKHKATAESMSRIAKAGEGGAVVKEVEITYKDGTIKKETSYASPQWQAEAWKLERTQPQDYGQVQRIHQTVDMSPEAKSYMAALTQANQQLVIEGEARVLPAGRDNEGVTPDVIPAP